MEQVHNLDKPAGTLRRASSTYGTINSGSTALLGSTSNTESGLSKSSSSSSVYIAIEANETTHLLRHSIYDSAKNYDYPNNVKTYDKVRYCRPPNTFNCPAIIFMVCITAGLILAGYLLWKETHEVESGYTLKLVQHYIWSSLPLPSTSGLLDHTKVLNVAITHTGSSECTKRYSCLRILNRMQQQNSDPYELKFSFLIGGDGQTYEARGWDYVSGCNATPEATTLLIAFIGNFTRRPPSLSQFQSAISLIRESVRRKKLLPNYHLYAMRNISVSARDGEQLFRQVRLWPNFVDTIQTL